MTRTPGCCRRTASICLTREPHVHRAVALPEDQARALELVARQAAERLERIPDDHLVERHAHLPRGVAAEVLVRQEQDLLALLPAPLQRRRGVRRGADGAAALADERLDRRGGVDVGDRHRARGHAHLLQLGPADLELIRRDHVGHRAAGGEVRQDDLLVRQPEDVGALGHEVHAAEDDVLGARVLGDLARELERVAGVVGEADHLVALVVVAEDDESIAERARAPRRCAWPSPRPTARGSAREGVAARGGSPSRPR